jgi:hypothetical protein
MGAGSSPAGAAPAGADEAASAPAPRVVTLPAAILFDGASGDYPLDADGRYKALHPVTQRIVLKLLVRLGSIGSANTTGAPFRDIKRGSADKRANQARQIVKTALKDDIAAGDIKLVRVDVDTTNRNATLTAVYFVNLRENPTGSGQPDNVTIKH